MKRIPLFSCIVFTILATGAFLNSENESPMKTEIPLNHFYIVLDTETYDAIRSSEFLKNTFGVFEQRTTVRKDMTYTGIYFYGVNTYFEFLNVKQKEGSRIGDSGIAFGMDEPGTIQELSKKISWGEPMTITRQLGDQSVPWFWMSSPKDLPTASGTLTWMMEYVPSFVLEWHPEVQDGQQGTARKAILAHYASFLKEDPAKRLMRDVIGLTVAVDDAVKARFVEYCSAFGYAIRNEGVVVIAKGPDITFQFVPQTEALRGIQQIEFRISGLPSKQEYHFGSKSNLKFQSADRATWSF